MRLATDDSRPCAWSALVCPLTARHTGGGASKAGDVACAISGYLPEGSRGAEATAHGCPNRMPTRFMGLTSAPARRG